MQNGVEDVYIKGKPRKVLCLKCNETFMSEDHKLNRICCRCKKTHNFDIRFGEVGVKTLHVEDFVDEF